MHVPAEQKEMAYTYISILVLGMFVTLAYNMCANVLRAIGDSMTPLTFSDPCGGVKCHSGLCLYSGSFPWVLAEPQRQL